ncbi:MAG: DNA repair protein RecO C-terminal domain-containing protein [Gammaproteobacteria bacterium]|nr:DNA repair protein RecO C-terminal domain-containing protein [Gammaproteobacteria bacterium]
MLEQAPVYCLHIRKYKETSVILECFSKNFGRVDMLGKGLLRPKNKNDLPEYFQEYHLSGIGRSELGVLTGLDLIAGKAKLYGEAWLVACYCNELLLKFLPRHEPVDTLYIAYQSILHKLQSNKNYHLELLWYEKTLLECLGYGINFYFDAKTDDAIESERFYLFDVASGFRICSSQNEHAIPGFVIYALAENSWNDAYEKYFPAIKKVIRSALKYQLGDMQLKTVAVSNDLKQFV